MFTRKKTVILYLLPALAGLTIFYVVPFIGGIYYSLTKGDYKNTFVWFDNYKSVWNNQMFRMGLRNTLFFSCLCAPLVWLMSFAVAAMLSSLSRGGSVYRSAILMPYLMPSCAMLLIWLVAFDYGGPINRLVASFDSDFINGMIRESMRDSRIRWLDNALRTPVILMYVWKNLGFSSIIFLAAFQSIPKPLYEYARLEGAGFISRAWHVTLPLIIPSAFLVLIMSWINAFKIFKEVYFISGAYPDESVYTLQHYMNNMFRNLNYQNVTTAAYIFAIMVFLLFGALFFAQKRLQKRLS